MSLPVGSLSAHGVAVSTLQHIAMATFMFLIARKGWGQDLGLIPVCCGLRLCLSSLLSLSGSGAETTGLFREVLFDAVGLKFKLVQSAITGRGAWPTIPPRGAVLDVSHPFDPLRSRRQWAPRRSSRKRGFGLQRPSLKSHNRPTCNEAGFYFYLLYVFLI